MTLNWTLKTSAHRQNCIFTSRSCLHVLVRHRKMNRIGHTSTSSSLKFQMRGCDVFFYVTSLPLLPSKSPTCRVFFDPAGANKRAELWRLRDHSNGYVHKPRPVPEPGKQSPVGKYQASCSRDPSVTIQQREIFFLFPQQMWVVYQNPQTKRQWRFGLLGSVQ